MSQDHRRDPWSYPDDPDPDVERTIAFEVPATMPAPSPDPHPARAPSQERRLDVARPDHRGSVEWQLEAARLSNRPATDVGLLLLRVLSLPLVLHGLGNALDFFALADRLREHAILAVAPELAAGLVVAGQLGLPVLLAVGFGTRVAALAQVLVIGGLYALELLDGAPLLDPGTRTLSGEGLLAYAALALPLVLTGPGRLSLDHAVTASGRERRVEKRVLRRVGRQGNA